MSVNYLHTVIPAASNLPAMDQLTTELDAMDYGWAKSDYYIPALQNTRPHQAAKGELLGLAKALAKGGAYINYAEVNYLLRTELLLHKEHFTNNHIADQARMLRRCPIRCDNPSIAEMTKRTKNPFIRSLAATMTGLKESSKTYPAIEATLAAIQNPSNPDFSYHTSLVCLTAFELQLSQQVTENLKKAQGTYAPKFPATLVSRQFMSQVADKKSAKNPSEINNEYNQYLVYLAYHQTFNNPTEQLPSRLPVVVIPDTPTFQIARKSLLNPVVATFLNGVDPSPMAQVMAKRAKLQRVSIDLF
jgi:hypothetical protein